MRAFGCQKSTETVAGESDEVHPGIKKLHEPRPKLINKSLPKETQTAPPSVATVDEGTLRKGI